MGKPLVFTEFGHPSVTGGGGAPWNDFLDGPAGVVDLEAQVGGLRDRSYTPRGKPAEQVLRNWYRDPLALPPPR